ncbi:MAG TPA: OmpH family outer membrane protein [Vicinamibacterales bacterium]|nr:OmpH family outer membrane protein [Vicinamibacterales bacterium]
MIVVLAAAIVGASLSAAPAYAQVVPPGAPVATPAPAPQVAVPAPFPADARLGYVNLQAVFNESNLGREALVQVKTLSDRLSLQLDARLKEIQGLSEKIKTQQGIASETAMTTWNVDLARLQREAQFAQQEARIQVEQLQQALLAGFQKRVMPLVERLRAERGLTMILTLQDGQSNGVTILAADPRVDLSGELVTRLNAER